MQLGFDSAKWSTTQWRTWAEEQYYEEADRRRREGLRDFHPDDYDQMLIQYLCKALEEQGHEIRMLTARLPK